MLLGVCFAHVPWTLQYTRVSCAHSFKLWCQENRVFFFSIMHELWHRSINYEHLLISGPVYTKTVLFGVCLPLLMCTHAKVKNCMTD